MRTKKYIVGALRVSVTNIRLFIGKIFNRGRLKFSPITCLGFSDIVTLSNKASIDFGKKLRTRGLCIFNAQENGRLEFGSNVFINRGCSFNCHDHIKIGDNCEIGPNVLIYDHDHDYKSPNGIKDNLFLSEKVTIGKNCWIGANSVILKGTVIGDNSVVAAGVVLKGAYPANSLIVQKRTTNYKIIKNEQKNN